MSESICCASWEWGSAEGSENGDSWEHVGAEPQKKDSMQEYLD